MQSYKLRLCISLSFFLIIWLNALLLWQIKMLLISFTYIIITVSIGKCCITLSCWFFLFCNLFIKFIIGVIKIPLHIFLLFILLNWHNWKRRIYKYIILVIIMLLNLLCWFFLRFFLFLLLSCIAQITCKSLFYLLIYFLLITLLILFILGWLLKLFLILITIYF